MKNLVIAAVLLVGSATISKAQSTATATATATIVTPISIAKKTNGDMSFGNIAVQTATGGTVVLSPAGGRMSTGGVSLPATAGTVTAAAFTVTGNGTYTYAITLPTSNVTLNHSAGAGTGTMVASAFTSTPSGTGALVGGTQDINVGATLTVGAAQAAGVYTSGNFNVTVNYN